MLGIAAFATASLTAFPLLAPGGTASADTAPVPGLPASCLPEQFPAAGAARNSKSTPYEIPFTATLGDPDNVATPHIGGGYLEISSPSSPFAVILGGPIALTDGSGSILAHACGLLQLPSQKGGITGNPFGAAGNGNADQYNNNFSFVNPINVSIGLKGVPGVTLLQGFGSADGELSAAIDPTPASNGGMNVEFESSAKATSVLTVGALAGMLNLLGADAPPALVQLVDSLGNLAPDAPVPGGECTVPIGDLLKAGVKPADLGPSGPTKVSVADATTPVRLTSRTSGKLTGKPVTGPITNAQAVLVANEFPVPAIDPNTPPSPSAPNANQTPSTLCTQAALFNQLLGLPSPGGSNIFYAPGTFAVHTSS